MAKKLLAALGVFLLRAGGIFLLLCAADALLPASLSPGVNPATVLLGGLLGAPGLALVLAARLMVG